MHAVNPFLPKAFNAADNQKEALHREQSIMCLCRSYTQIYFMMSVGIKIIYPALYLKEYFTQKWNLLTLKSSQDFVCFFIRTGIEDF